MISLPLPSLSAPASLSASSHLLPGNFPTVQSSCLGNRDPHNRVGVITEPWLQEGVPNRLQGLLLFDNGVTTFLFRGTLKETESPRRALEGAGLLVS